MNVAYVARDADAPDHLCVVIGCGDRGDAGTLWVTVTGSAKRLDGSHRLGPCCEFHATVVPEAGIHGYTHNLSTGAVAPADILPPQDRPAG